MTKTALRTRPLLVATACLVLAAAAAPAFAQLGPRALVAPGEALPAQLLLNAGGPAARDLAAVLGKRPVLGVYWRPGEAGSEQALVSAAGFVQEQAPDVEFFPVAALAAGQAPSTIGERLRALGLDNVAPREDSGRLAQIIGVRMVPSFFLLDAGAVVRLVGGIDLGQSAPNGVTIADALVKAGRGEPVPTLGVLAGDPVYRMLGRRLPDVNATKLDGATWRKLSDVAGKGRRVLLFYWSPTCPHCKAALPGLRSWLEQRAPKDLQFVDVARGDAPALRTEAAKIIADYPGVHLLDVDKSVGQALLVRETPTVFLVSPKGEIEAIRTGGDIDWNAWLKGTGRK